MDDSITLNITLHDISQTVGIKIDSHKKMTTEKNETLLNLYEKEKKDINVIKEIEKYLKDNGLKDALEKVNEIKKKYDK